MNSETMKRTIHNDCTSATQKKKKKWIQFERYENEKVNNNADWRRVVMTNYVYVCRTEKGCFLKNLNPI